MCLTDHNVSSAPESPKQHLPFCSFCLREKSPNQDFYKTITSGTPELRKTFQTMLGYDFQLTSFTICRPCWKLMQLVQDIRVRCFKANELVGVVKQGFDGDDGWFSAKTSAAFENARIMIKEQTQEIDKLAGEVYSTNNGYQQDAEEAEQSTTDEEYGDLESEITIGEIKMEISAKDIEADALVSIPTYTCEKCSRLFDKKVTFMQHSSTCKNHKFIAPFSCKFCPMKFINQTSLDVHLNKHTGTKPFKCGKHCTREFFSVDGKLKHEQGCIKDPHKMCSICEIQLPSRTALLEHHKRVHPGEPKIAAVYSFTCKFCGKVFMSSKVLASHMQTHGDLVTTHPCTHCDRVFLHSKSLVTHVMKRH